MSEDRERAERGINDILEAQGHRREPIEGWWDAVAFPELGNRTIPQAWLAGKQTEVAEVIEALHRRSQEAAERAMADPTFRSLLEARLARLAQ